MPAVEPAEEMIVRNLHQAVRRLRDDLARVELWAGALDSFAKPVPVYDPAESRYALRRTAPHLAAGEGPRVAGGGRGGARAAASKP